VITGISFSYANNSMNTRGLQLLSLDNVYDMTNFNIPICDKNSADGKVPQSVDHFMNVLERAKIVVFAIPECTAHYGAGFKNAMDWLICASNFNADLGQDGPFFNKPIYIITFTPSHKNAGGRHFDMTKHLLEDKMGGVVYNSFVKHSGWEECVPGNYKWLDKERIEILNTTMPEVIERKTDMLDQPNVWIDQYNIWNNQWRK